VQENFAVWNKLGGILGKIVTLVEGRAGGCGFSGDFHLMLRQLGWDQAVAELAVLVWWSAVPGVGSVLLWRLLLDWGCWRLFAEDVLSWALALRWILTWRRHLGCVEVAMNELASLPVWAVAILHILLAQFGFVEYWNIGFCHHLLLSMGKWALKYE